MDIFEEIPLLLLHWKICISRTAYLPRLVNVVYECPMREECQVNGVKLPSAPFSQVQVHLKSYFWILHLHTLFSSLPSTYLGWNGTMCSVIINVYCTVCTSEPKLVEYVFVSTKSYFLFESTPSSSFLPLSLLECNSYSR